MVDEPIFESVDEALKYAYRFQGKPDVSSVNRMPKNRGDERPPGKGLIGIDGAGQSGFIKSSVRSAGLTMEALVIGHYMPRTIKCPCRNECCIGYVLNRDRYKAIEYLANVLHGSVLAEHRTNEVIRRVCAEGFYDRSMHISHVAENLGISRNFLSLLIAKSKEYLQEEYNKGMDIIADRLDKLIIKN